MLRTQAKVFRIDHEGGTNSFEGSEIALDPDLFFRSVIRELAGTMEHLIGLEEASGFVSVVGQQLGESIGSHYQAVCDGKLSREQVADALVDLKRRIGGDFFVIEQSDEKIVLGNRRCPFGDKGARPSVHLHDDVERVWLDYR